MNLRAEKCFPCSAKTPHLTLADAKKYLKEIDNWQIVEDKEKNRLKLVKRFRFKKYLDGIKFVEKVANISEEQGHHPDLYVGWCRVTVNFTTHISGGLTINDFIMAAKVDIIDLSDA
ncbi:4a-hydroxytetrahydrobiopterin dehydratase [Candidatus Microgenomates bacterium]|nr:4a-hydroxytetrahydrobiopterin dehydratase [Candidatus Microgenomates bacterium]